MMRHPRRLALLLALLLAPVLAAVAAYGVAYAGRSGPDAPVLNVLRETRAAGTYHLTADVRETRLPRATAANIGRADSESAMRVEADVVARGADMPDVRLALRAEKATPPIEVRIVAGKAYVGYQDRWQTVDNPLDSSLPDGDYLGYLSAVVNVAKAEPVRTAGGSLDRYTFALDGPRYAEYQRARMEKALAGQVPQGVTIGRSARLEGMRGTGELWVDGEGRARRQILDVTMPGEGPADDSQLHMVIDFSRFGDHVPPIVAPVAGPGGALTLPPAESLPAPVSALRDEAPTWPAFALLAAVSLLVAALGVGLLRARRRRRVYAAVVTLTILSMVGAPLVNVGLLTRFQQRVAEASTVQSALGDVGALPSRDDDGLVRLGVDVARLASRAPTSRSAAQGQPAGDLRDCRVLYTDQSIDPTSDTDGDGLPNADEWCGGTDYRQADTDSDTLTDTLEIGGYTDAQGKVWVLDPLLDDTNQDGIADGSVCDASADGQSLVCSDTDGDGVPDVWDDDIDNDGVVNRDDISPFGIPDPSTTTKRVTPPYRPSVDIDILGAYTKSVVYVDVQLQPQTASHLRYSSTWLDWPADDKGQIQNLSHSSQDVQLIPVLEFTTTVKPSLASLYGISVITVTDAVAPYFRLWTPLQTVGVGGQVSAFAAHIAFTSAEVGSGLSLLGGRLLWLTQAQLDSWKNCQDPNGAQNSQNCQVDTNPSVVASYYDDMIRVTGLQVTESKDVQVAQFGAPTSPEIAPPGVNDEGRIMLALMSGLAPSFLGYQNPTLPQIVQNFNTPGSAPYSATWGITPTLIATQYITYTDRDAALATTSMTTTAQFLTQHYGACATGATGALTPTLAVATQDTSGSMDMGHPKVTIVNGDPSVTSLAPIRFQVPLGLAALSVTRRTQLGQYTCGVDPATQKPTWRPLSFSQALKELDRRYPQAAQDPTWALIRLVFSTYYGGLSRIISVNGKLMPYVGPLADWTELDPDARNTHTLPDYVRTAYQLDQAIQDVANRGVGEALRTLTSWLGSNRFWYRIGPLFGVPLIKFTFYTVRAFRALPGELLVDTFIDFDGEEAEVVADLSRLDRFRMAFAAVWRAWTGTTADEMDQVARTAIENEAGDVVINDTGVATKAARFEVGMRLLSVALLLTTLITVWTTYGTESRGMTGIAADEALVTSIASTIVAVLQFIFDTILSLSTASGVGLVIQIVLLIVLYLIIGAATHDWNPLNVFNHIISWLVDVFLKIDLYVNSPDVGTGRPNLVIDSGSPLSQGALVSASVELSMTSVTTLTANTDVSHTDDSTDPGAAYFNGRQGNLGDVKNSWAFARIDVDPGFNNGQAPSWTTGYSPTNSVVAGQAVDHSGWCDSDSKVDAQNYKNCFNTMAISFKVIEAGRNLLFPFLNQMEANLAYQKCEGFIWYGCSSDMNYSYGPTQAQDPDDYNQARSQLYMDVLPATVDLLWTWGVTDPVSNQGYAGWNLDRDADVLTDTLEAQYNAKPTEWDTDNDALADGYEVFVTQTRPDLIDTDADGLDDGFEVQLGLDPNKDDTDTDGLKDGEEVCHLNPDHSLGGGWRARLDSGRTVYVCSDPNKADEDGDGLTDRQEHQAGTSPWAPNTAPGFTFAVDPTALHNATRYTVVRPGGQLTATLSVVNTTADPLDKAMTLGYDTNVLGTLSVLGQSGSQGYTPTMPTSGAGGLTWNLKPNPLLTAEALSSTLGATLPTPGTVTRTTLLATVPYTDPIVSQARVITASQEVRIDFDDPTSTIAAPTPNQAINAHRFLVGGDARDSTSWPVKVETRIQGQTYPGGQNYDTAWQTATGTDTWSYAWNVPGDGPYTIQSRATDYVGHVETPGPGTPVIVDRTPPVAAFKSVKDGEALQGIRFHTVTLSGVASDTVSGSPKVAGLSVVQLSIDNRSWRDVAEFTAAHPATGTWSFNWTLDDALYGTHSLAVRAVDALGQVGPPTTVTVFIDLLPPSDIWSNATDQIRASGVFTFEGHADDLGYVPLPSRPQPLSTNAGSSLDAYTGATAWLMPHGPTDDITKTVVWLGDINGDGRADFAVGTPSSTVGGQANAGQVALLYGKAGGWPVVPAAYSLDNAEGRVIGPKAGSQLGQTIAPAGDVNGDGLSDYLIGDPVNNLVYLLFGSVEALGELNPLTLKQGNARTRGKIFTVGSGQVGNWLAAAGDVNGDGYDDVLIGVTGLTGGKGVAYLVLGSNPEKGALGAAQQFALDASYHRPIVAAAFATAGTGAPVVGVGDVNGDQYADIALADPTNALGGGASVYVFLGGATYQPRNAPTPVNAPQTANGSLGGPSGVGQQVVPLGDVNGDSLPDFAYTDGATPHIAYGRASGWRLGLAPDVTFTYTAPVPNGPVAGVGDVNVDGKNDILLGTVSGRAYLVLGAADLAQNQPVQAQLANVNQIASAPFASGADVNCDSSSDLLIVTGGSEDANPTASREFRRGLRRELGLGPATAPVPLNRLPVSAETRDWRVGIGQRAGVNLKSLISNPPSLRFVDDDYCATCPNDGHAWGVTAFATLQAALDAAVSGDTLQVNPGVYGPAAIAAGKNDLTIQGVDADAVFIDAGGGTGLQVYPPGGSGGSGVTIQQLTIRNATTGIQVNQGGAAGSTDLNDPANIRVYNVLLYLDRPNSIGIDMRTSNVDVRHATLVANSGGVSLLANTAPITNAVYLRDSLLVALPNAAPKPQWWQNSGLNTVFLNTHNGFAGPSGSASDWASAPSGSSSTLMTLTQAAFYATPRQVFRLLPGSAARGQANGGADLGYYQYHPPVWVSPAYCEKCANAGRAWNVNAFTDLQSAISSGAQQVLIEPGLYRERVYLVNGVRLFGSGAALTVIAPPTTTVGSLVSAEAVQDASLALLTLAGDGHQDGLHVEAGAFVSVTRAIIRNTVTAVAIDGAAGGATVQLLNNTLVNNDTGVAAVNCGNLDVEDTVFAFHTGAGLSYQGCATTRLHNFNAFWSNHPDQDLPANDSPGQGNVFADPRFVNASQLDFRPKPDSPLVDAGDPSLPTPPGTGARVDIGYAQAEQAAVYVSPNYCAQCLNDGLEWGVDAFTTIQAALDHIPALDAVFTVGVAPGTYTENLNLRSGVRLVGAGADTTIIDGGGTGSVLTLDGVTHVEVRGFSLQNAGSATGNANVVVSGYSNNITVTHNVLQTSGGAAAIFDNASTGAFLFNTVANNQGAGLVLADPGTWVQARFNIFAYNSGVGVTDSGQGQLFNSYNLFYQNSGGDTAGTVQLDPTSIQGQDPQFVDPNPNDPADYNLVLGSPAVDAIAARDWQPVPIGGGDKADIGYWELLATPLSLLFGKEGTSCAVGSAGVASVQVGVSYVPDASVPPDQTQPPTSAWHSASVATPGQVGSYWTLPVNMTTGGGVYQGDGLYRLYTRPTDEVGNTITRTTSLFRAAFIADGTPPVVSLITPTGSLVTSAPALPLQATASDSVPTGSGTQNNLARVYFTVDGAVVTATAALGQGGTYQGVVALPDGAHTVTAVAVDRAGNVGRSQTAQVTVQTTRNEAALISPTPGSAVVSTTLTLVGPVHFVATDGQGQVEVLVDGTPAGLAALDNPEAPTTTWRQPVTLNVEGTHTVTLRASRTAGSSGSTDTTATLVKDSVPPTLDIRATTQPFTSTLILNGTYADATSGVAAVDVSVDGGFTYTPASELVNNTWTYLYHAPLGQDFTRFPLRVRATDHAGNRFVQSGFFLVDNLGPTPFVSTASPDPGTHLTAPATASLFWAPLHDGSGDPTVVAVVDQISNTIPVGGTPFTGRSYTANFPSAGAWYVHLQARDVPGNTTTRHYGPWFVGTAGSGAQLNSVGFSADKQAANGWQSSIIVDGRLNVAGGEWDLATERLDVDPRPTQSQSLWASFDATNLYLGWRGARWGIDGTGYVYLDTTPGGTTTPWAGPDDTAAAVVAGKTLPFAADYVLALQPQGQLRRWDGAAWQPVAFGEGRAGPDGDTEVRLPWADLGTTVGAVDLHALAFDIDQGRVASVFPTNQSVLGPWTSAYHWSGLTPSTVPNTGQPTGGHVTLGVAPSRGQARIVGPGGAPLWTLDVRNLDRVPVSGVTLEVEGSPGLTLEAIQGAPSQPPGGRWTIPLGDLAAGPHAPITVTARVAANVASIDAVTLMARVKTVAPSGAVILAQSQASLAVDNAPPVVRIDLPRAATMRSGPQTVTGAASDASGIDFVEVRVGDGPWLVPPVPDGVFQTLAWGMGIDAPASGSFVVQARGHDIFGQTSEPVSATVLVDNTSPTAGLSLPSAVIRTSSVELHGTTLDPFPADGAIERVEVQVDDGAWQIAPAPYPLLPVALSPIGARTWRMTWRVPQEEGVQHRLRVRAIDAAGNVGAPSDWQTVTVDTVAPTSTLDYPAAGATVPETCLTLAGGSILVWGTARDGWGVDSVQVSVNGGQTWTDARLGADAAALLAATLCQGTATAAGKVDAGATLWAAVVAAPNGDLALRARAVDRAGNVQPLGTPVRVRHTSTPVDRPYRLYLPVIQSRAPGLR